MKVKNCAVAGHFYPRQPAELRQLINSLLRANPQWGDKPKAVIVPHAAPRFSGAIAALGFNRIRPFIHEFKRVVILGPAHRVAFNYVAALDADIWRTPLGDIAIDRHYTEQLISRKRVQYLDQAHEEEHSIEVQLPFLQAIGLAQVPILPLVVGAAEPALTRHLIVDILSDADNLLIISSDLSHFQAYQQAIKFDRATINTILSNNAQINSQQACGCYPINGFLAHLATQQYDAQALGYCNSGDTGGSKDSVVGYASFAFTEIFNQQTRAHILAIVRQTITQQIRNSDVAELGTKDDDNIKEVLKRAIFQRPYACFVTLNTVNGGHKQLRGCIGNLQVNGTLGESLVKNAALAAFKDTRFQPLAAAELAAIEIEVSILTRPQPLLVTSEQQLIEILQVNVDGLILRYKEHQATFLPAVWAQLNNPIDFIRQLKLKAGLAADFWSQDIVCFTYQALKIAEKG